MSRRLIVLISIGFIAFGIITQVFAVKASYPELTIETLKEELRFRIERLAYYLEQEINLAALSQAALNPNMKYVAIREGMRREEIATIYQKALDWNDVETQTFAEALGCYPDSVEGYLFPAAYVIEKDATPEEVKQQMIDRFNEAVAPLQGKTKSSVVNMDTAVRIASIIQREAAGKSDMKLISGIIWNRLFEGMTLDIDATLQYVKGDDTKWWPQVKSEDKYLESPYNTYQNKGLPPSPISNPGLAAIDAALNPQATNCIFYIHDNNRRIHCAKTYKEHKRNIDLYLK
jgi:UPF0755 protein